MAIRKSDLFSVDTVFTDGKIVTVDDRFSVAQAVAIKNGVIVAVGTNEEVTSLSGQRTRKIDLKGATVLPGINDSHCHISDWALSRPPLSLDVRFPVVRSVADIVRMVAEKARTMQPGEWIVGEGWDEGYLEECVADPNRKPGKADLDQASPNNPVFLVEYSGHRSWVNSLALSLAGITETLLTRWEGESAGRIPASLPGYCMREAAPHCGRCIPPWSYAQRKEGAGQCDG